MATLKTLTINGTQYNVVPIVPSASVILPAAGWVGSDDDYYQVVELEGVTPGTKVDLQPTPEQVVIFLAKTIAFVAENNNCVVTVHSIGHKPENDYTIQVTLTEVGGEGPIRGNTVGLPNTQADWNQTDPKHAGYIKNKPEKRLNDLEKAVESKVSAEYVQEQVEAARDELMEYIDENASSCGVSGWNDLPDKPFGEEGGELEVLLPEETFTFAPESSFNGIYSALSETPVSLTIGETYTVMWDEKTFVCTAFDVSNVMSAGAVGIGNGSNFGLPGNNEPFAIVKDFLGIMLFVMDMSDTSATHKVSISLGSAGIKTLDAKYLPMDAIDARIEAKLAEIPDVSEVGM